MDGSKRSDCIKKRPKLFIEKIMPVNLLNEQVYYEHGGNPFKDCCIAGIGANLYPFLALRCCGKFPENFLNCG